MRDLYKEITEHSNYIKKQEVEESYTIKQGIILEMDRIAQNKATKFNKGDYFTYEEQDYNWLIQKLAGTPDSTYMGCPLKVPETVVFTNGKPCKVIKTTPDDNCVNQIKSTLTIPELRKHLLSISQDRNTEHKRKLRQMELEQQQLLKKQALERAQMNILEQTKAPKKSAADPKPTNEQQN